MYLYRTEWTDYGKKNLISDNEFDVCMDCLRAARLFFYSLFI